MTAEAPTQTGCSLGWPGHRRHRGRVPHLGFHRHLPRLTLCEGEAQARAGLKKAWALTGAPIRRFQPRCWMRIS